MGQIRKNGDMPPDPFGGKYRHQSGVYTSDKGISLEIAPFKGKSPKSPTLQVFEMGSDGSKKRLSGLFATKVKGLYKFDFITATGKIEYFLKMDENGRGFQAWTI